MTNQSPLLQIQDLTVHFHTQEGIVHALNGISFSLKPGESMAIVGESGSGKTVTAYAILQLIDRPPGRIKNGAVLFQGQDLLQLNEKQMQKIRGREITYIPQDPMTALNPARTIGQQIQETIQLHLALNRHAAKKRVIELLTTVGIPDAERRLDDYPRQFSGGQRQRILIAMALACNPALLIADEPTTALDVTIQAQIVALVKKLKARLGMAVIWITHDLGVAAGLVDKIAVLYSGFVMEIAPVRPLFKQTSHPYTLGLLQSLPIIDAAPTDKLIPIDGTPPDLYQPPKGCPFAPRCRFVIDPCWQEMPPLLPIAPAHYTACWQWETVQTASQTTPERPTP